MISSQLLDMGVVAKTHGVRGELKIRPSCDSPAFLALFQTLVIGGKPVKIRAARPHKEALLVALDGVDTVEDAMRFLGKRVQAETDAVRALLPPGRHLIADLIGCRVVDAESGLPLGQIAEVHNLPKHDVYVVESGGEQYMIPVVGEFVKEINPVEKTVRVSLIEGMAP